MGGCGVGAADRRCFPTSRREINLYDIAASADTGVSRWMCRTLLLWTLLLLLLLLWWLLDRGALRGCLSVNEA